jgi:hypothetical protein
MVYSSNEAIPSINDQGYGFNGTGSHDRSYHAFLR